MCHYCKNHGHINPFYYQKKNDKYAGKRNVGSDVLCNVVYMALRTIITCTWYFDSGCSRHMTGDKSCLSDFTSVKGGCFTCRGGAKGSIVGKWTLNIPNFPDLKNAFYVEGLTVNFIIIS